MGLLYILCGLASSAPASNSNPSPSTGVELSTGRSARKLEHMFIPAVHSGVNTGVLTASALDRGVAGAGAALLVPDHDTA